jgi:hypothetical protein
MTSDPHAVQTRTPIRARNTPAPRRLLPRSEGTRYRQLTLELDASGAIALTWHETGAAPEAAWGGDDNEVTLRVRSDAVARLAFAMIEEQLRGRTDGLDQLRALCTRHGIEHDLACWT